MDVLDKNSNAPLYQQLAENLLLKIREGQYVAGNRLPSEFELSEQYNVSRITVRKAIELLTTENVLSKQQGKGTYILPTKSVDRVIDGLSSFSKTCRSYGIVPSAKLLSLDLTPAPPWVASFMNLSSDAACIIMRRIRYADGVPVIIETNYFPSFCSFLFSENLSGSLHEILCNRGISPTSCTSLLDVCIATLEEAQQLQIYSGKPLLLLRGYYLDAQHRPLYASKDIINPDRFKYSITSTTS